MYDARHIANQFIRRGLDEERALTPMHIQKLVYFAHARFLAFYETPLIKQTFEAWPYGPVVRVLYDDLKSYGAQGITDVIPLPGDGQPAIEDHGVIDWSYKAYGHISALTLSDLTHSPEAPWAHTKQNTTISNALIRDYYAEPWISEWKEEVSRISRHPTMTSDYLKSMDDFDNGRYYAVSSPQEVHELISKMREGRDSGDS